MDVVDCKFIGANLRNTKFFNEVIQSDFSECDLKDISVQKMTFLQRGNIFFHSQFSTSSLAKLLPERGHVYLEGADLSAVDFQDVAIKTKLQNLDYLDLTATQLNAKNLQGCFSNSIDIFLEKANLIEANLDNNDLSAVELSEAKLSGASIKNSHLNVDQLFDFYEQGHRDFCDVSISGKFPPQNTLAGASLSSQIFEHLAKNNFLNFSGVNLQSIPKEMLAFYHKHFSLLLSDALLPDDFTLENHDESDTSTIDVISCLKRRHERSENNCLISWDDVEEFNEETLERRNTEKIKINSEQFSRYLAEISDVNKERQLIKLASLSTLVGNEVIAAKINRRILRQDVTDSFAKLAKLSSYLTYGLIAKDLLAAVARGEYKAFAFNSGFLVAALATGKMAEKLSMIGEKLLLAEKELILANSYKLAAPFISRFTSVFFIYDLALQIQALKSGKEGALSHIIGDSLILGGDVTGLIIETLEIAGFISEISPITAPIISTIGGLVMLALQIDNTVQQVEKINALIPLTGWDKFTYVGLTH